MPAVIEAVKAMFGARSPNRGGEPRRAYWCGRGGDPAGVLAGDVKDVLLARPSRRLSLGISADHSRRA